MELSQLALTIHQVLLDHFGEPTWHAPLSPLDELVSTILSQNTNDRNRDRAFHQLRSRFSTWEAVRDASAQEVIAAILPAGLAQQKGPRIQQILKEITQQRGSLDLNFLQGMPAQEVRLWLQNFKGVGPKTAAIVMQFSLNKPAFPVDTHIYRVTGRLGLRPDKMSVEHAHPHLASLFPESAYSVAHLNLIRLGREVCQARQPRCPACPLQTLCKYYQNHLGAGIS